MNHLSVRNDVSSTNPLCVLSVASGISNYHYAVKSDSELLEKYIPVNHDMPSTHPSGEVLRASLLRKI